jgi:hypothetical protein
VIDRNPLRNYAKSRAVLIGTSGYIHLPSVPAASNSLDRMSGLLASRLCGWPKNRISTIRNERNPGDLPDKLITLFEDAEDVALFYFVGHGQVDINDELCLGLVGSRPEPHRRAATSLQFQAVRNAMLGSPAKTKIIVLDCCFAGLANKLSNTLGTADVLDLASGTGAYTMAACSSYATAWFESGSKRQVQTYFTKYLADTIEAGIPGEPAELRLRVLFGRVREKLAYDSCPLPEDRNVDSAGDFPFARNAAPPPAQDDTSSDTPAPRGDELGNLSAALTTLSRRNHPLIDRLARMIDSMEQNEVDPEQLAKLFAMDHLITRARRNSENLLVLAGEEPARKWTESVPLADVARAAASEIEQYNRVALAVQPGIMISGQTAADVVHLLAELIENATLFSPQSTQVDVTAVGLVSGGVLVEVRDDGVGVSPSRLADMNLRLGRPPVADEYIHRHMGLYVVSRLAARHGIRVNLHAGTPQGLSAAVWLPPEISSFPRTTHP